MNSGYDLWCITSTENLLLVGAGALPTAMPAYPTLTVSAPALWAADHLLGNGS
jgi:choline dehydrogenase-like flavoprotein